MQGVRDGYTSQNCNAQDNAKDGPVDNGPKSRLGTTRQDPAQPHTKTLVAARHTGKRRTRSQEGRVQADEREEDRLLAQAIGGTQFAPQVRRLRSALSMLTFYINRAGKTLPKTRRTRLERAKVELKHQFGRE
jgi:Protein of unknown function (DUF3175)